MFSNVLAFLSSSLFLSKIDSLISFTSKEYGNIFSKFSISLISTFSKPSIFSNLLFTYNIFPFSIKDIINIVINNIPKTLFDISFILLVSFLSFCS